MLGSPPEQAEQVKMGTTDMGLPTQGQFDKWIKAMGVVMLPFAYDDYDHVHRVLDGPAFQWFSQMAEKEGFILLSNWEYGFRNLTNNKRPINAPEDVKGLKVRVPPEMQIGAAFEALGAPRPPSSPSPSCTWPWRRAWRTGRTTPCRSFTS